MLLWGLSCLSVLGAAGTALLCAGLLLSLAQHLWTLRWTLSRDRASALPLPKGSMGWPFFGETLHWLVQVSIQRSPYPPDPREPPLVPMALLCGCIPGQTFAFSQLLLRGKPGVPDCGSPSEQFKRGQKNADGKGGGVKRIWGKERVTLSPSSTESGFGARSSSHQREREYVPSYGLSHMRDPFAIAG